MTRNSKYIYVVLLPIILPFPYNRERKYFVTCSTLLCFMCLRRTTRVNLMLLFSMCKYWLLSLIIMDNSVNICPICERRMLSHSYSILCNCCLRHANRNCTQFSHYEFEMLYLNAPWYCRLCNETIFAFNHIDDDSEFQSTITNFMSKWVIVSWYSQQISGFRDIWSIWIKYWRLTLLIM